MILAKDDSSQSDEANDEEGQKHPAGMQQHMQKQSARQDA
jgi:hypothetical protein